jgi:G:T/U-mismatch repair DNA glycosylase
MEHTQIVGTSKSKPGKEYYISSKEKFWGVIAKSKINKRYEPGDSDQFSNDTGVGFAELVFDIIVPKDKELKNDLNLVTSGITGFVAYLKLPNAPKTIVFNGKSAAGWFFQFIDKGKIDKRPAKYFKEAFPDFNYGLCPRQYNGIKIYVLPNTSGAAAATWDEKPWLDFWNSL